MLSDTDSFLSREREFNLSIQPALAYVDMLESFVKVRMAAKQ